MGFANKRNPLAVSATAPPPSGLVSRWAYTVRGRLGRKAFWKAEEQRVPKASRFGKFRRGEIGRFVSRDLREPIAHQGMNRFGVGSDEVVVEMGLSLAASPAYLGDN